jgi:hypothetical protein
MKKHIDPIVYPAGRDEFAAKADHIRARIAHCLRVVPKRSQKGTTTR